MEQMELIDKRKPREKHFLQKDGTIRAEIYDTDIHYMKDGKYEEIDNTLIRENDSLVNKNNNYKVEFKDDFRESLIKMSRDNHFIDFKIRNIKDTKLKSGKRKISKQMKNVTYNDIADDISVEYKTLSNKVKETIVLKNANYSKLSFELKTNLKLKEKNGEIVAFDENGIITFVIEKPYMLDSNKERNENIHYSFEEFDDSVILDLILDDEWLQDPIRKFPVFIDPTITNNGQNINIQDTYIYPGDSNDVRYNEAYLKAGVEKINNVITPNRSLIKFNLPTIGTGSEIVYANIDLTSYPTYSENPPDRIATIHQITSNWDESTANWNNMNDKYNERVESIFYGHRSTINNGIVNLAHSYYDGNITNIVKKWYRDVPNYGIMIKSIDESNYIDDDYPAFYSNDNNISNENNPKPIVNIVYRNHNGIEDYLNYKTQLFTGGKAYVNTYNGNLTTIFNLGNTIGGNFPAYLELIYNTNDVILNNETFFKKGFRLNFEQIIKELTIDNNDYLEYIDEDGTAHYFIRETENNIYNDVDGLSLNITKEDLTCTMKDSDGNESIFTKYGNNYRLTRIKDIDENFINIAYNSDGSIQKIIDTNNYEINISYNNDVINITSPDGETILRYNSNKLYEIENAYGTTFFAYENDLIKTITDITGLKIKYDYYLNSPYRIRKVTQIGLNDTQGDNFTLDYGFDSTNITDRNGKVTTLMYNSYGNIISENSMPNEEDIENAYSVNYIVGTDGNVKNKTLLSETPIKYIKNYLKNSSFENDNLQFTIDDSINYSYSTELYNSGLRSLKLIASSPNKVISRSIEIPKGEYYTFSGFFLTSDVIQISLSYYNCNNELIKKYTSIESNENFEREDVTIYYEENASSDLKIEVLLINNNTVAYIDDIQLEKSDVANGFNIIENSDFSEGYSEWELNGWTYDETSVNPSNSFSIARFNNNQNTALKVSVNPTYGVSFTKTIPVKGRQGDLYTLSFWYKNLGIPGYERTSGSSVSIYFKPIGGDAEYCIATSDYFNPNEDKWQLFTYRSHAPEDFESIKIVFLIGRQANDFYLTNLTLYKDVTSGEYSYDEHGNLITISDESNNTSLLKYDSNDNLLSFTNASGKNFKYEYDNNKKSRIINTITHDGIANKIKYDSSGNPISIKVSKRYSDEIIDGLYKIRNKGTNNYVKAELNTVFLEESECSNTIWKLQRVDSKYKIIYSLNEQYTLSVRNGDLILDTEDSNNLFELEKNIESLNGTYYIKYNEITPEGINVKFLTAEDLILEMKTFNDYNFNIEFYIEPTNEMFIEKKFEYTTDEKKIVYNYNTSNGVLESVVNANNIETEYGYDSKKNITSISIGNKSIIFQYDQKNLLRKIIDGSKEYIFEYDNFLRNNRISLSNNICFYDNTYSIDGKLLSTNYGNNGNITYEYDEFNRIKEIHKQLNNYVYRYDNNGNLAKILSDDNEYKYYYDKSGRLYKYKENNFSIYYTFNSDNNIQNKSFKYNNLLQNVENTYTNNLLSTVRFGEVEVYNQYDILNRVVNKNINNIINYNIVYLNMGKKTSSIITDYVLNNNNYHYEYDNIHNITDIFLNNNIIKHYEYNDFNELTREIDYENEYIIKYSYDSSGNKVSEVKTSIIDNTILEQNILEYENTLWEDQLTKYNNDEITYDSIGNPISIGNNISMLWKNGNELSEYNNENVNVKYKYNMNGIRISKTINDIETKYYLDNNNIIYEVSDNSTIYYLYDMDDIIGMKYNNVTYYYEKNMHDDVIGIRDNEGNKIVSYSYDSWGNILSIKDGNNNEITNENHIGIKNPFRYRSYYYDNETELYYLQHRYYNPKWGRFISPDILLGANKNILGYNLYLYVSNNPVNYYDNNGYFWKELWNSITNVFSGKKKKAKKNEKAKKSSKKTNSKKTTSKKSTSKTSNITTPKIQTPKQSFVAEAGFGIGGDIHLLQTVGLGGYQDVTIGVNNGMYTNITQSAGIGLPGIIDFNQSRTHPYPYKDDDIMRDSHKHHSAFNTTEFNNCPSTETTYSASHFIFDISSDGKMFTGIDISVHFLVGFHIKIGIEEKYE